MKTLLQTMVVSQLEYGCVIWSPTDQQTIDEIESIQKDYTKKISIFKRYNQRLNFATCNTSYMDRLQMLKLNSLERRRERYVILYMFKFIASMVPDLGIKRNYNVRTKLHLVPKYCNHTNAQIQKKRRESIYVRGPLLYNKLPAKMRELPDTKKTNEDNYSTFKAELDEWIAAIPDQPGKANSILNHVK